MTSRRIIAFVVVAVLAIGGTVAFVLRDYDRYRDRIDSAPPVPRTSLGAVVDGPRVVFRNTAIGNDYGLVAVVPLDDLTGPRAFTDVSCDRIDASPTGASCLVTKRGVVTRYAWLDLGPDLTVEDEHGIAGLPSRTRLSPDGSLTASTVFVSGHSYMQAGFSTATRIREVGGTDYGNLERFDFRLDGERIASVDRNVWGVTFADDTTFYATVATGGTPYLVKGNLTERTLTAIHAGAECPALSPDGTHIAYKKNVSDDATHWTIAVLDLATDKEVLLDGETASVDDQVQWLDDDTVLYGLPRADEAGVTDVWQLEATADATPQMFLEQAWSPAVIH
ncbi:hypothetical protein [Nocardioides sp. InS609-2]|uniref:hypothetical protein n=1 Tax=Nocardioides sp. InS609-2 TaxID=2760705 RepID=UPI0020C0157D|nr:hypothetical protein [Nocardioides sp. InS609-2]